MQTVIKEELTKRTPRILNTNHNFPKGEILQQMAILFYAHSHMWSIVGTPLHSNETESLCMGWHTKGKITPMKVKTHLPAGKVLMIVHDSLLEYWRCYVHLKIPMVIVLFEQRKWMLHTTLNSWARFERPTCPKGATIWSAAWSFFTIMPSPTLVLLCIQNWKNFTGQFWIILPPAHICQHVIFICWSPQKTLQ